MGKPPIEMSDGNLWKAHPCSGQLSPDHNNLVIKFLFVGRKEFIVPTLKVLILGIWLSQIFVPYRVNPIQSSPVEISVFDLQGNETTSFTDGDRIQLRVKKTEPVAEKLNVQFVLESPDLIIASCTIAASESECSSDSFSALGWYWGNGAGTPDSRFVIALDENQEIGRSSPLTVSPRPVVLVHGFLSNFQAWNAYLGPTGFLAGIGLHGFAVGDGQVAGTLITGSLADPLGRTNTVFKNAAVLQEYINGVKQKTGAQMVDLMGHSMGGMISRVYIDRLMGEDADRDVAQLIMLGSPSLGSDCANLPVALGWYLPAALEIRSSYAKQILNPQVFHRKGVEFFALAGDPILKPIGSPCTTVPSDSVVSLKSVSGIPLEFSKIPLLHTSLNTSDQAFGEFVLPLLQKSPGDFSNASDPAAPDSGYSVDQQFSQVYTGHLDPGESRDLTIQIETGVSLASFAMHNPDGSLETIVTGASGKQIPLDTEKNGLFVVDDPESLVQLGYGFENPKPGVWKITLNTTQKTPVEGADFALTARITGGAVLQAGVDKVLPEIGEPVIINAELSDGGTPLSIQTAEAKIHRPDAKEEIVRLQSNGNSFQTEWKPDQPGIYGIDLLVTAQSKIGEPIERSAFLSVEAQPDKSAGGNLSSFLIKMFGVSIVGLIGLVLIAFGLIRRGRHTNKK